MKFIDRDFAKTCSVVGPEFITGCRLHSPRRPKRKKNPDWALNLEMLRALIKKMFPRAGDLFENRRRYTSFEELLEDQRRLQSLPRTKSANRREIRACKQANTAGMYLLILYRYRYFLEHRTASWIAADMADGDPNHQGRPITAHRVDQILQECRYAAAGLRRNGEPKSNGKRGPRPRKRPDGHAIPPIINTEGKDTIDLRVLGRSLEGDTLAPGVVSAA